MTFTHAISWFEIPALDISRAQKFYETIFDIQLIPMEMPGNAMLLFPIADPKTGIGGAIVKTDDKFLTPSADAGTLIYLNANPDVDIVLNKVEAAGGKVLLPKTEISPEYGFMGVFLDTEGNRVGLHSVPVSML